MMSVNAHHYGVTVSDLDESIAFYRDALGLEVVDEFSIDSDAFNTVVGTEDVEAHIAFLDAGDCLVELVEYDSTKTNLNEGAAITDIGSAHFGFQVNDASDWYEQLVDDYDFISEPQTLANGVTLVWLYDPDGNSIELVEE